MLNTIINRLNERGYKANIINVTKNGVVKTGICIGEGKIRPTVYPDDFNNHNIDEIVDMMVKLYEDSVEINIDIDIDEIATWEYARENLQLCIQKRSNEDILKRNYLDLEIYIRVHVDFKEGGTYKVKSGMFKDISDDIIFKTAFYLTKKNFIMENMFDFLLSKMNVDLGFPYDYRDMQQIIVTSKSFLYGASAICYPELLKFISNKFNCNLIIIPSSIHECIVLPEYYYNDNINELVKDVNCTQLEEDEVLSDHIYLFDKETCKITY